MKKKRVSTQLVRLCIAGAITAAMTLGLGSVATAAPAPHTAQPVQSEPTGSDKAGVRSVVDAALKNRPGLVPTGAATSNASIAAGHLGGENNPDTLVTVSAAHGAKSIIKSSDSSTSLITVLESGSSASFEMKLPADYRAEVQDDGTVSLVSLSTNQSIRFIEAPWAVDAVGKALDTSYRVEGSTLVQSVVTDGAVYPIVADPQFGWMGIFPVVQFNRAETATSTTAAGVLTVCSKLSGGLPVALGACAISAVQIALQAVIANANGECIQLAPAPVGAMAFRYSGGYCS